MAKTNWLDKYQVGGQIKSDATSHIGSQKLQALKTGVPFIDPIKRDYEEILQDYKTNYYPDWKTNKTFNEATLKDMAMSAAKVQNQSFQEMLEEHGTEIALTLAPELIGAGIGSKLIAGWKGPKKIPITTSSKVSNLAELQALSSKLSKEAEAFPSAAPAGSFEAFQAKMKNPSYIDKVSKESRAADQYVADLGEAQKAVDALKLERVAQNKPPLLRQDEFYTPNEFQNYKIEKEAHDAFQTDEYMKDPGSAMFNAFSGRRGQGPKPDKFLGTTDQIKYALQSDPSNPIHPNILKVMSSKTGSGNSTMSGIKTLKEMRQGEGWFMTAPDKHLLMEMRNSLSERLSLEDVKNLSPGDTKFLANKLRKTLLQDQTDIVRKDLTTGSRLSDMRPMPLNKHGGSTRPIEDDMGQWAHPGEVTKINSNQITMKGVPYPVLGVSDKGHKQMMYPGQDYSFKGSNVTEYPIMQGGGRLESYDQYKAKYNLTETPDYNLKRAYELGYTPDKDGHLPSVDSETLQFLKTRNHPTVQKEIDWFNSKKGKKFRKEYKLDSTDANYYKYVPKKMQDGGKVKSPTQEPVDKVSWYEALNWKNWGLPDYSDKKSFNEAFRAARNNKEDVFYYDWNRYTTDLVPKKDSDNYFESKKFVEDYYNNNPYRKATHEDSVGAANRILIDKYGHYEDTNWGNSPHAISMTSKDPDYTKDLKKVIAKPIIDNLNDKNYYFSITRQKPKYMESEGSVNPRDSTIFMRTGIDPGKIDTTPVHELTHKATLPMERDLNVPKLTQESIKKVSPYMSARKMVYLMDPNEVEARKLSTHYYLEKEKGYSGKITQEVLDSLRKDKKVPFDIKQMLDLYKNQPKDLVNYLNNEYEGDRAKLNFPHTPFRPEPTTTPKGYKNGGWIDKLEKNQIQTNWLDKYNQ